MRICERKRGPSLVVHSDCWIITNTRSLMVVCLLRALHPGRHFEGFPWPLHRSLWCHVNFVLNISDNTCTVFSLFALPVQSPNLSVCQLHFFDLLFHLSVSYGHPSCSTFSVVFLIFFPFLQRMSFLFLLFSVYLFRLKQSSLVTYYTMKMFGRDEIRKLKEGALKMFLKICKNKQKNPCLWGREGLVRWRFRLSSYV